MSRRLRPGARSALGAFLLAAALTAATGCAAGFDSPTNQPYTPADGVNGQAGEVLLRDISLVTDEPGGPAALVGGFVNESGRADTLVSAEVVGSGAPGYFPDGTITLPRGALVSVGMEDAPGVTLTGPEQSLQPGNFVGVRFVFENAGATTVQVLVQPQSEDYATITPTPSPTAEPTRTPRGGGPSPETTPEVTPSV